MRGKIESISRDILSNGYRVVLNVREVPEQALREFSALDDLDIDIKKHRERRSLNANSYFHVLVTAISKKTGESIARVKNEMIFRYGQPETIDDEPMVYKTNMPPEYAIELETIHLKPIKAESDKVTFYRVYRGSSDLNTKEMAQLIDGTISEAKEWGIETLTPAERERMMQEWEKRVH